MVRRPNKLGLFFERNEFESSLSPKACMVGETFFFSFGCYQPVIHIFRPMIMKNEFYGM